MGAVKTTIELPDAFFHQARVAAALRGESMRAFVTAALRAHLESQVTDAPQECGWRSVYWQGQLRRGGGDRPNRRRGARL